MNKIGVGIIGCGVISDIYLENLSTKMSHVTLVGCADLVDEKATIQSEKYNIKKMTVDEMLKSNEIGIIVNITIPKAHFEVCEKALLAGKHVYVEKPLSLTTEQGKQLLMLAEEKGLLIGGAPDTFLGGGIQTCVKLIQDGWLGDVVGANAFMTCHGHESWHADPEFYYKPGAGPMFDMGPYYLTALVKLIGSIKKVGALTSKAFEQRTITSAPKFGQVMDVEVMTHVVALLEFENGATGQLTTSFDVWKAELPRIEIYGTKGTLSVPDPNTFGGPIKLYTPQNPDFLEIPMAFGFTQNSRGLGVSKMAEALLFNNDALFEANGKLTYHVLEVMESILLAGEQRQFIEVKSRI
jgi:predicted dehydrogenase